jgi:hypothetical protein
MSNTISKVAVDQDAKNYWKLLFGEYGDALVRDIPRRIKAALVANKKVASAGDEGTLRPVASVKDGETTIVEGVYSDTSKKLLFKATLDKEGNVSAIDTVEVR